MKELFFYDKRLWNKGPWTDEPDYQSWFDNSTHYACVARRNPLGAWCGYVGIDPLHNLYGARVGCEEFKYIDVHGDVAFADWAPVEDRNFYPARRLWWIGFDCMQDDDLCPVAFPEPRAPFKPFGSSLFQKNKKPPVTIYRSLEFVRDQIEFLSSQLSTFDNRFFN